MGKKKILACKVIFRLLVVEIQDINGYNMKKSLYFLKLKKIDFK
jgi:hypothetical protein